MINVNDIEGTVTMSLADYETIRDRGDKEAEKNLERAETLNKLQDEFNKEKESFEKGLVKKCTSIANPISWKHPAISITWVGKTSEIKSLIENYDKAYALLENKADETYLSSSKRYTELYNKLISMSIFKFSKWRKYSMTIAS